MDQFMDKLDELGVEWGFTGVNDRNNLRTAELVKAYPTRLKGAAYIDPAKGMAGVRELEYCVKELGLSALYISPIRIGMPANDKRCYSEELSISEIHRIAQQFGRAAARAKCAGFDSVEIHAGHGYLINQFLSPLWNHRTDEFGGSLENRARFCRLVTSAVREAVGPDFPVLIRLSLEEFLQGGNSLEDSLQLLEFFQRDVDLIDASVGTKYAMDVAQLPDGWRTYLAKAVKSRYHQPCAVMGNIRSPEDAEEILCRGEADLIVIGRGLLADPQWAAKAQQGRSDEIRPCISCNVGCVNHRMVQNRPIRCTVNPSITCEPWTGTHKVARPCTVVVVGGGIAGLEAACIT